MIQPFFTGFKKGTKGFGHNISTLVNSTLLCIVYLLGAGLTSITAKIIGKHFLDTKIPKESYWENLDLKKKPIEEYYRQF